MKTCQCLLARSDIVEIAVKGRQIGVCNRIVDSESGNSPENTELAQGKLPLDGEILQPWEKVRCRCRCFVR